MNEARREFWEQVESLDPAELVFVDETGIDTRMVRRYARAPTGERAHGTQPATYRRLTVIGGLAAEGLLALMSSPHAMDTALFLGYLDQVLIPELARRKPNAIVVLDNLKPHHAAAVKEKLAAAGLRLLYLPPYSPDFAPVEPAWSKLKTLLRTAAKRSLEALEGALARVIDAITPEDAHGYFTHCGYDLALH